MPSLFPGMDPFLEDPAIFPGLHGQLVAYISEAFQAVLPEAYFADIGDRVWVEISSRNVGPDVTVLKGREAAGQEEPRPSVATGSIPVVVTVP